MRLFKKLIACALLAATAMHAQAAVLNWNTIAGTASDWVNGALSQSFNVDAANPGNDITISIVNTAAFTATFPKNIQNGPSTVGNNDQNYLQLRTDGMVNNTNSFVVTITFNYAGGVYANFGIIDIDRNTAAGGWTDNISAIKGIAAVGGADTAITVVGSAANTVSGTPGAAGISGPRRAAC